jgi:hypothetical protein
MHRARVDRRRWGQRLNARLLMACLLMGCLRFFWRIAGIWERSDIPLWVGDKLIATACATKIVLPTIVFGCL